MTKRNDLWFNVDFIRTKIRELDGVIGNPDVPTFDEDSVFRDDDNFPDSLFLPAFPHRRGNQVNTIWQDGIRLSGGIDNRTGWKLGWDVTYNGKDKSGWSGRSELFATRLNYFQATVLDLGGGIANGALRSITSNAQELQIIEREILNARIFDAADAETFDVHGSTFDILDRNLYPYGSIGLITNDPDDRDGTSQLFDLDFQVTQQIESYGAGTHFSFSPFIDTGSLAVRATAGGRFFRINERFNFYGVDSGLAYTFNFPDGLDGDDDFVIDNVEEEGTTNFTAPAIGDPIAPQEILIRSFVDSTVRTSLAGPEFGIEYDLLDEDSFRVSGATTLGVMFNTERLRLRGDNIGNTAAFELDPLTGLIQRSQMFDTTTAGVGLGSTPNAFNDRRETTHLSPLFEQSFNAELPIFSKIPVLRDMHILEEARLNLGWRFTWIGEVADPNNSIVWVSNPRAGLFPYLSARATQLLSEPAEHRSQLDVLTPRPT